MLFNAFIAAGFVYGGWIIVDAVRTYYRVDREIDAFCEKWDKILGECDECRGVRL